MKYFFDFEFMDNGILIDPLSIGIVSEDGREYYAEFLLARRQYASEWVKQNVIPKLWNQSDGKGELQIGDDVINLCLCQLFGTMEDLPKGWPMFAMDIKQWAVMLGNPKLPEQGEDEHHALADARWNKKAWEFLDRWSTLRG